MEEPNDDYASEAYCASESEEEDDASDVEPQACEWMIVFYL